MLRIAVITLSLLLVVPLYAGENIANDKDSFAKEYATLKSLLQKVKSRDSAELYKPQIEQELARLKSSQLIAGKEYDQLDQEEKKLFIKKFQNNQFHCGEVTQVMEERRRILLNPDLYEILGPLVQNLP